ncbi:hypothetical protein HYPSUDRAFT_210117 [Hypholoma sublateritium FD-334 SS-4]|uniref:Uncharacterized protein n=1 Tax=Hypholoma sublateritium (strain FD-334 SS-4) TaxID=945553 RepID=A0A0D2N0S8_HYPSF|nr:hypothetical protein HYPSUDRAFT_210117 [Hypholoma sublateritium FD-334 SS-4]
MPAPALSPSVATHDTPAVTPRTGNPPKCPPRIPTHIDGPTMSRKRRSMPGGPTATFGTTRASPVDASASP